MATAVHKVKKPNVYYLQNQAIHKARQQLEDRGIIKKGEGLAACRFMAGKLNLNIESISSLSLKQREILIDGLKSMGAQVRNPKIYESDLWAERSASGSKELRKIIVYPYPTEDQLRMVDALANQIHWREQDGYLRFCYELLKSPRPRNGREVTKLRLALESMIAQQAKAVS